MPRQGHQLSGQASRQGAALTSETRLAQLALVEGGVMFTSAHAPRQVLHQAQAMHELCGTLARTDHHQLTACSAAQS